MAEYRLAARQILVNPDQIVDQQLESVTAVVRRIVLVIEEGYPFRGQQIRITQDLVPNGREVEVRILVLDKRDRISGITSDVVRVVELRHVPAAPIIAHRRNREADSEVERRARAIHTGVPNPPIEGIGVTIEILAHGRLASHGFRVQMFIDEYYCQPLRIVNTVPLGALGVERPGLPVQRVK